MFDNMLDSRKGGVGQQKNLTFPVSMGIHLIVVAVIIGGSYLVVEQVSDPDSMISFVLTAAAPPPPPPPPPPPASSSKPKVEPVKPIEPDEIVQPTEVPDEIPKEEPGANEDGGVEGGVEGGVPGGVPGGVVGGVVGGVLGGVLGGVDTGSAPIAVSGDVKPPVLLKKVQPEYPEIARKAKIAGKVLLQAVINENGDVESAEVLRSQPMLDQAAIDAVRKWKYQPATLNGKAVKVYFTVQVNFSLQ